MNPVLSAEPLRFASRFTFHRCLGSGAFGTVFEVHDEKRGVPVALKILREAEGQDLYRFKLEFRSLVDLAHPNLVTLYELLSDDAAWAFSMELIRGVDFQSHIKGHSSVDRASGQLGEPTLTAAHTRDERSSISDAAPRSLGEAGLERLRRALRQLTEGVGALHAAGRLHCDLKPSNVLVDDQGRVAIVDLGLVTHVEGPLHPHTNWLIGTPAYMSPEQAAGRALTEASDWYQVGVMLFEALTGKTPFTGTAADVMAAKLRFEPPRPSDLVRGLPDDLDTLCEGWLRRDPMARLSEADARQLLKFNRELRLPWRGNSFSEPFVGRDSQLDDLWGAFEGVKSGRPAFVQVIGDSGVGKSALIHHFLQALRRQEDVLVLEGRCYEEEQVPYKALDGVVDSLSHHLGRVGPEEVSSILSNDGPLLARVFPVLAGFLPRGSDATAPPEPLDPAELRHRTRIAFRQLLGRLAARRPLVLLIDDLQWGDEDSDIVLETVLERSLAPPLLFIVCLRPAAVDRPQGIGTLAEANGRTRIPAHRIVLQAFAPHEARALARALLPAGSEFERHAQSVGNESGGSPYLVHELVYEQLQHGPESHLRSAEVSLEQMIRSRVAQLPGAARRYLEAITMAGRPLDLEIARGVAQPGGEELSVLSLLRAQRLVKRRENRDISCVEPYHDHIRQTVKADLSSDDRRDWHRALVAAWKASGKADDEILAHHYDGAGEIENAAHHAVRAAAQASQVLAFDRAATHYRLALRLLSPPRDAGLRRKLADTLANAGRVEESALEYETCAETASPPLAMELRGLAANQFLRGGHVTQGLSALRQVLKMVHLGLPRTLFTALCTLVVCRARVLLRGLRPRRSLGPIALRTQIRLDACWTLAHGLAMVDPIRASAFQARHLLMALDGGDDQHLTRALTLETGYSALFGIRHAARTRARIVAVKEAARRVESAEAAGLVALAEGASAFMEGRWSSAAEHLSTAENVFRDRCRGVTWELATSRILECTSLFFMGELCRLQERLPPLVEGAQARGDRYEATLQIRLAHAASLAADRPAEARRHIREVASCWPTDAFYIPQWWALVVEVEIALYEGRPEAALEVIRQRWKPLRKSGLLLCQYVRIQSLYHRAHALVATARHLPSNTRQQRWLIRRAELDAAHMERERTPWGTPLATLVRAGVAAARGQDDEAMRLSARAGRGLVAVDMTLFAAAASCFAAQLRGGDAGRAQLDEARATLRGEGIVEPLKMAGMFAPM